MENIECGYEEVLLCTDVSTENIDLDIVCVYNDEEFYKHELLASLRWQETSYAVRVLGINNVNGKYTSMAQAYNDITKNIKGKYVLFLHQDIRFYSKNALHNIINQLMQLENNFIWGSGGVVRSSRKTISTKSTPIEVETVDECFFGMSTQLLHKLKFNEQLCDDWHMYAAEICLHNKCVGGSVCVIKADITHLSPGKISKSYVKTLYKVINYYSKKGIKSIWTTCAKINLEKPYHMYIFIWYLKHVILNKIVRPLREICVSKAS